MVRVALDAMGGDFAPSVPVSGALEALNDLPASCELILVGREEAVETALAEHGDIPRDRLTVVDAPETIEMNEKPLAAVRGKRRSSIRIGLELQKEGKAAQTTLARARLLERQCKGALQRFGLNK